jgi:FAD/FMN-containing dehydrogenase
MEADVVKNLGQLTDKFEGQVVRPSDPGYDAARVVWNGMIDRYPALIVRPTTSEDVSVAIRFARDRELTLAVRCGGHSIPGLSTCDDGMVIDLSLMRGAHVDPQARVARVGGGALLGELDDAAQQHGLVCPVGVVSHTGVGGLTLGGGMGRLQRRFGLTIDNLVAVDLVTAGGELVRASADERPDLFWGLRGAGANFGVAVAFEFRLQPLEGSVTHGVVMHPVERAEALAERYRELVVQVPEAVWASFGLGLALPADDYPPELAGNPVAYVAVLHSGPADEAERDLTALRGLSGAAIDSIETKPYLTTQRLSDDATAWGHRFSMRSNFLDSLPDDVVGGWTERVAAIPGGASGGYSVWSCGGAMAAVADQDTAFTGRDARFWAAAEIQWDGLELDDACRAWGRSALDEAQPYESAGRYVNDVAEVGRDVARTIYGDAKYERLRALKREWDPDNVFRLNQNIQP